MPTVTTALVTYSLDTSFTTRLDADASTGSSSVGMTFTVPSAGTYVLDSMVAYLAKGGAPTGNATSSIYAITGTPGSTATPTGSALGVSGTLAVTTLTTSPAQYTFTFSGANRISLTNSTTYFITVDYSGGDVSNYVITYSPLAPSGQNYAVLPAKGSWSAEAGIVMSFTVYGAYNAASILGISTLANAGSITF